MFGWITTRITALLTPPALAWAFFEGNGAPGIVTGGGGTGSSGGSGAGGRSSGGGGSSGEGASGPGSASDSGTSSGQTGSIDDQDPAVAAAIKLLEARGLVPNSRMAEVIRERNTLRDERTAAERTALAEQGRHEELARKERERADKATVALQGQARRVAFMEAATGRVANVGVALKLAQADGMLATLEVDDEGNVTKGDPAAIVRDMLDDKKHPEYAFLKPGAQTTGAGTGGPASGAGASAKDVSKMSSEEKVNAGLHEMIGSLPAGRQGLFGQRPGSQG